MSSSLRIQDLSRLKNVQQWLKHPAVWSGIASIGAHGLLFALLPLLNMAALNENPPDLQRSVDLVELTPEEQQRLPEFPNEAPIDLPPIAEAPNQTSPNLFPALPPLTPLPNETLPPISPSFTDPLPIPSFPVFPTLPPPPRFTLRNPPAGTPEPLSPSPSPSASPQTPPSPVAENPELPQLDASPLPSPSAPAEPAEVAQDPPASPPPSPQEQLIARQQELRQLYTYNPEGTSNEAALQSDAGWLEQVSTQLGEDWNDDAQNNIAPDKIVEIAGTYPRAACVRRLSASAILGVVVDGEGKVVQEPVPPAVLRSSGYGIFNQLAIEAATNHSFEATGKRLPYRVLVKFEPTNEVCPPGSAPPSPESPPV